jgi:sugar phosphate permease
MKENRKDKAVTLMAAALVSLLSFVGLYALLGMPEDGDPDWMGLFIRSKVVAVFCLGLAAVILRGRPQSFGLPQNKQAL